MITDNDRDLLELAAKAAGWKHTKEDLGHFCVAPTQFGFWQPWNPLTDDGDALRLAVKLDLFWENLELFDMYFDSRTDDKFQATRRAIVRAAAEIGKTL